MNLNYKKTFIHPYSQNVIMSCLIPISVGFRWAFNISGKKYEGIHSIAVIYVFNN